MDRGTSFRSAGSGQHFDRNVCVPHWYVIPRGIIRRGFQRMDAEHSPGCPGELRGSLVIDALDRFDTNFGLGRRAEERLQIVEQLEQVGDHMRVWWNGEPLLNAFRVQLCRREQIFFTIDVTDHSTFLSCSVSIGLVLTILLSIAVWMISTIPDTGHIPCDGCPPEPQPWMIILDDICVCIFTAEYLARLATVSAVRDDLLKPHFLIGLIAGNPDAIKTRATGKRKLLKFVRSPSSLIDMLTILPYWIELVTEHFVYRADLTWLRIFRMMRLVRVFKLFRLLKWDLGAVGDANHLLASVCRQALPACGMLAGLILTALIVFSALIFTVERGEWYPEPMLRELEASGTGPSLSEAALASGQFLRENNHALEVSPFSSIPAAFWWTLVTITTVGYGDAYPVTVPGKAVGFAAILYGAVLLGLPVGIIGAQFEIEFSRLTALNKRRSQFAKEHELLWRIEASDSSASLLDITASDSEAEEAGAGEGQRDEKGRKIVDDDDSERELCVERQVSNNRPQDISMPGYSTNSAVGKKKRTCRHDGNEEVVHVPSSPTRSLAKTCSAPTKKRVESLKVRRAAAERVKGLPLSAGEHERLQQAKYRFEDALRIYGESLGISAEQQQIWAEDLVATQLIAGPALDRLGARVLARLAEEAQVHPGCSKMLQSIRQAWHELSVVCCQVAETLAEQQPAPQRAGPKPKEPEETQGLPSLLAARAPPSPVRSRYSVSSSS